MNELQCGCELSVNEEGQAATVQAVQKEEGQGTFGLYGEIQYTGRH